MTDKKTQLIGMLKTLASNLGHIPSRDEAVVFINRRLIDLNFGSYSAFVSAAGLSDRQEFEEIKKGAERIIRSQESIRTENDNPSAHKSLFKPSKKILCIPDIHAPFHSVDAIKEIIEIARIEKPDLIIQLGDAFDMFSFSKFPHQNIMTHKDEILSARATIESMWDALKSVSSPSAQFVMLYGNHEQRLFKRVMETAPAILDFISWREIFAFNGVHCEMQDREPFVFEGINFIHGWKTKIGDHMKWLHAPVVHGHSHRPGFVTMQLKDKIIWELDCGHVSDVNQIPMQYTSSKITHWAMACGLIDKFGPRVILL